MSKKSHFGWFLIIAFCAVLIFSTFNPTIPSNQVMTNNSPGIITNSSVNVTHPADLQLLNLDSTNRTISWVLSEQSAKDYLGFYSFTNDTNGADPAGWTKVEPSNTVIQVVESLADHHKVVELRDDNNGLTAEIHNTFSAQTSGTIEFWIYGKGGLMELDLKGSGSSRIILIFYWELNYLRNWRGGGAGDQIVISAPDLTPTTWHHIRIIFNRVAGNFNLYYDGNLRGTYLWWSTGAAIDEVMFYTTGISGQEAGHNTTLDAIDYSWAPGYYLNRNMAFSPNPQYAIFENGTRKTPWQPWINQVNVKYNVTGTNLGVGLHNVSLVFNSTNSQWFHDDVMVTVLAIPNIVKVNQDPITPFYPQYVNITAHITEDTQVQTVKIESNHTGILTNYSMSLLSGSLKDGTWNYTLKNYSLNKWTSYKIFATDNSNYMNSTGRFNLFAPDTIHPTIMEIIQTPIIPSYLQKVNVIAHITDNLQVQGAYIETNYTRTLQNYNMSFLSGTLQDGLWNYTFPYYPTNTTIFYRILTRDIVNNLNGTNYYNFGYFDIEGPNISSVIQTPLNPGYNARVNVTVRITEQSQIQWVYIENDFSGSLFNDSMNLESGNNQDGVWSFAFPSYLGNRTIFYRIYTCDALANWNQTTQYSFGYFDIDGPNIVSVVQTPPVPSFKTLVNITAQIMDKTQTQWVYIETNYTGSFSNYSMTLLSGGSMNGVWNFIFTSYPENRTIGYRIYTCDALGNWNQTTQYSFGYFDIDGPNIVSVSQIPATPGYKSLVNVSVHLTDFTQIESVQIETNYTLVLQKYSMMQMSGNSTDGVWKFTFNNYPINQFIFYRIITKDILGNLNSSIQFNFGVFDTLNPTIASVNQIPAVLTKKESVYITVNIIENFEIKSVKIESNITGTWTNQTMNLLSGSLQNGNWDFTFITYPINQTIQYRIFTIDVSDRTTTTGFYSFGIFPLISWNVPLDLIFKVDIGMAGNGKRDFPFNFKNTGNTKLLNINFTIALPTRWTADVYTISIPQLLPNQSVQITFHITVPKDLGEFQELVPIYFEATIYELAQKQTGIITTTVFGVRMWDFTIWLVIIVGSVAAMGTTTLYVIRRKQRRSATLSRIKPQVIATLKTTISKDFPSTYTINSPIIIERINNMKELKINERELLFEYITQLDEEEAVATLDEIEKIKPD